MANAISLVIWDWNGTLLDDVQACLNVANGMLAARGMRLVPGIDAYRAIFRFPVVDYYRDMGYTFEEESFEAVSVDFVARYKEELKRCSLMPGAETTLRAIANAGIPQTVLSATGEDRLSGEIASFGLRPYFETVIGLKDNLAAGKAEQGLAYVREKGIDPARVLFIGDTDHDAEVARTIGCRCILIPNGHQPAEKLAALGVPMIGSLPELIPLLGIKA